MGGLFSSNDRSSIRIEVDRTEYAAGDIVEGNLLLNIENVLDINEMELQLVCTAGTEIGSNKQLEHCEFN